MNIGLVDVDSHNFPNLVRFRWFLENKATPEEQDIARNAGFRFEKVGQ